MKKVLRERENKYTNLDNVMFHDPFSIVHQVCINVRL